MEEMLTDLCYELRNWFEVDKKFGKFDIVHGSIDLTDFVQEGQYFRLVGSVFNDGVYQYPAVELTDEKFQGAIWAMSVPKNVLNLCEEISTWQEKFGSDETVNSPYQSESFGGYSYSKASGSKGGTGGAVTWQAQFASRLNRWRKI